MPEDDVECKSFTVISIDSLLDYENKYYLQVYLENICTHNSNNNDNNDSNNNDNNDNDDNDNNEFILEYSFYMKFALCPKIIYKKRNTLL